jgi:hypothetical protein
LRSASARYARRSSSTWPPSLWSAAPTRSPCRRSPRT